MAEEMIGNVDVSRAEDQSESGKQALAAWIGRNLHGDARMNKAARSGKSVYSKKKGEGYRGEGKKKGKSGGGDRAMQK